MRFSKYLITLAAGVAFFTGSALARSGDTQLPAKGLCAHRGGMDTHPENTIPAFKNAIAAGVQMIEFDIQLSKDGQLVIMHDETVDRTTNGSGKISDLTLAEIKALDAGIKKGQQFAGTRVPTFEETLAVMPRNIWLNCHLKGGAEVGKASALLVQKLGRKDQCFLACVEDAAAGARAVVPDILICNTESRYRKDNAQYAAATIGMKAPFIQLVSAAGTAEERQPSIDKLKANRVHINYFYAAKAEEAQGLWKAGIDFILVNDLPSFLPEMKKAGIQPVKPKF